MNLFHWIDKERLRINYYYDHIATFTFLLGIREGEESPRTPFLELYQTFNSLLVGSLTFPDTVLLLFVNSFNIYVNFNIFKISAVGPPIQLSWITNQE